jgi:hypothetical protein
MTGGTRAAHPRQFNSPRREFLNGSPNVDSSATLAYTGVDTGLWKEVSLFNHLILILPVRPLGSATRSGTWLDRGIKLESSSTIFPHIAGSARTPMR